MHDKAFVLDGPLAGQVIDLPDSRVVMWQEPAPLGEPQPEAQAYTIERIAMQPNLVLTILSAVPFGQIDQAAAWRAILRPEIVAILEER
jgi:hypothetical protein